MRRDRKPLRSERRFENGYESRWQRASYLWTPSWNNPELWKHGHLTHLLPPLQRFHLLMSRRTHSLVTTRIVVLRLCKIIIFSSELRGAAGVLDNWHCCDRRDGSQSFVHVPVIILPERVVINVAPKSSKQTGFLILFSTVSVGMSNGSPTAYLLWAILSSIVSKSFKISGILMHFILPPCLE